MGRSQSFLFCRRNAHTSPTSESLPIKILVSYEASPRPLRKGARTVRAPASCACARPSQTRAARAAPTQRVAPDQTRDEPVRREDSDSTSTISSTRLFTCPSATARRIHTPCETTRARRRDEQSRDGRGPTAVDAQYYDDVRCALCISSKRLSRTARPRRRARTCAPARSITPDSSLRTTAPVFAAQSSWNSSCQEVSSAKAFSPCALFSEHEARPARGTSMSVRMKQR